jgi:hypothetical protein
MRRVSILVVGSMTFASGALAAQRDLPAGPEAGRFDGSWTVEARTTVGSCPSLVPGAIEIRADRIVASRTAPASTAGASPWGYVDADGTIVTRFTTQGHVARAHGQLRGAAGSGAWSSSTDMCGGVWRARRGGAQRAAR